MKDFKFEKNENQKLEKGITLVALIITVIVLTLLTGITISAVTNGGIMKKAKNAVNTTHEYDESVESQLR